MTQAGPLNWVTGAGWLILVGGRGPEEGTSVELDDRILVRADSSRPVAFVLAASASLTAGEVLLDEYAALGGPPGYVVPILHPADARDGENARLLADAGIIILADGDGVALAQALQSSKALDGMAEAFISGALIVGVGAGAAPLGELILAGDPPTTTPGWGWVGGALVAPHFCGAAHAPGLQAALRSQPGLVGLGLPDGVALALGPEGQVETWGEGEVTVVVAR